MVPADRLDWQLAKAVTFHPETPRVLTIGFEIPGWRGHLAGQHVDVRLTAPSGYQAQRSYSVASAAGNALPIELTVERIIDGEVSSFLTEDLLDGDTIELRGPIGGYFTWDPKSQAPLMLIAGGSGVVPLVSMLRTRAKAACRSPARLLYSSRTAEDIIYRDELDRLAAQGDGLLLTHTLTRRAPAGWAGERRRVDQEMLSGHAFAPSERPQIFICGPTLFVESIADRLVLLGHVGSAIKTERFGPTGEKS